MKNKNKLDSIHTNVISFLQQRAEMLKAGFPYCFTEKGVQMHCDSCIKFYKTRKETHKQEDV